MDRGKKETIEKNLSFVKEEKHLFIMDVNRYLASCARKYGIIYADPPFRMEEKIKLAEKVSRNGLLEDDGLFIIHFPEEEDSSWPDRIESLTLCDRRKYGRSILRFYKNDGENRTDEQL